MQNIQHTLAALRNLEGLESLEFNSDGVAEVLIEGVIAVYFHAVSETQLELSCVLDDMPSQLTFKQAKYLLAANAPGGETGMARLAIDEDCARTVLCYRLDVTKYPAEEIEGLFAEFLTLSVFWLTDGTDSVLAAEQGAEDTVLDDGDSVFIRL